MEDKVRCMIAWCPSSEPLLRRREDSPLFKRFGAMVLCATHVPPWRKEEYEPLVAPPVPTPSPVPRPAPPKEPATAGQTPPKPPRASRSKGAAEKKVPF